MSDEDVNMRLRKLPKGTRLELFRVIQIVGTGIQVEVQAFHTKDVMEIGVMLAEVADVLSGALTKFFPENSHEENLSMIIGTMVGLFVRPLGDIDHSFRKIDKPRIGSEKPQ